VNLSDPETLNTTSRVTEDPAAAKHTTGGTCAACQPDKETP